MSYKFEIHCHTSEISQCATANGIDTVKYHREHGYDGLVITNHYHKYWFDTHADIPFKQMMKNFIDAYKIAKKAGDECGLEVLLGMELRFTCRGDNDYLIYGFDEDFLFDYPDLHLYTPEKFRELADEKGLYFGQAHPGRSMCTYENPALVHGMEVFNGHNGHDSANEKTYDFVKENGLIPTVGSDYHFAELCNRAAMLLPCIPHSSKELAKILLNGEVDGYAIYSHDELPENDQFVTDKRFVQI